MISLLSAAALATVVAVNAIATPTASYLPQTSPAYLPNFPPPAGVVKSWPPAGNAPLPFGPLPTSTFNLNGYPQTFVPVANASNDPNIVAVMALLDWNKVPSAPPTTPTTVTDPTDQYCWWTRGGCVNPKVDYIPPDISICSVPGTWGLTYDDGPMYYYPFTPENSQWAEPNLYDFLLNHNSQKADLFYYASKIPGAPDAAQRGLNDGHIICVHTWSHPSMTTLTNAEVVAEFYYSLRMIKEVLGITPKCWRPPYGDVDDRVRAIAWQMGMRTIMWDEDTNDWNINGDQVAPGPGAITYETANNTVNGWIQNRLSGNDTKTGHIVLEHELSNATITLTEFWLPTIQKLYKTMPATACNNIAQPYWEENFIYPIQGTVAVSTNGSVTGTKAPTIGGSNTNGTSSTSGSSAAKGASDLLKATTSVLGLIAVAIALVL
ncbi:chitin deacetylase [Haplosporangium sp. Z 27]|nr:chitin deacetylase [Haplosporangium sp. Z 27]